ncbi:MAG: ATP-binding protein [Erythrobacter sp.]
MTTIEPAQDDPLSVDASPTKSFFVQIIVKDIQLDKAILDLVDNSIDGAKRLRPDGDYHGLSVDIDLSSEGFQISDNCGGIPLETARKYAFKFGRAEGFEETDFSVGQFGVGMKRALFKMGREFEVASSSPSEKFDIEVNVDKWIKAKDWDFRVSNLEVKETPVSETGTSISVRRLHDGVKTSFDNDLFLRRLKSELATTQQHFMRNGLVISVKGEALITSEWQLKSGEGIEPFYQEFSDSIGGSHPLKTRLYAGIGGSKKADAGWYVFCNGRCILNADQGSRTGWSETTADGTKAPKYHGQFSRFRGYVFLDCKDASVLPWNTTKTDLDYEHAAYFKLLERMITSMRPVIDFLNDLDAENDYEEGDRELTTSVAKAQLTPIDTLTERAVFSYKAPKKKGPPLTTITYKRRQDEVETLKEFLGATSNKAVGEKSFDFAFSNLVED